MRPARTTLARACAALALLLACALPAAAQNAIVMYTTIAVPPGKPVALEDLATVTGPDAQRLGRITILSPQDVPQGTAGAIVVPRAKIKTLLEAAGINWAKATLNGGTTSVLVQAPAEDPDAQTPPATSTPLLDPTPTTTSNPTPTPTPTPQPGVLTLRAIILDRIATTNAVQPADVRLRFDGTPADLAFLDEPVPSTWSLDVTPLGTGLTGRTPVRIEAYAGDRVALSKTVQAIALVRVEQPLAAGPLARGQVLTQGDVTVQERWLPPGQARVPTVQELVGVQVKKRLEPGRPITSGDVETPVVINRGDDVVVQAISGGLVIKTKAKALTQARQGERVTLQLAGSKNPFVARAAGRGSAVLSAESSE